MSETTPSPYDLIDNLRHALREAAAEMDRRYEMGVAAERRRILAHVEERVRELAAMGWSGQGETVAQSELRKIAGLIGGEVQVVHWTPEEEDQSACDADTLPGASGTMLGTLNPDRVTCPACRQAFGGAR